MLGLQLNVTAESPQLAWIRSKASRFLLMTCCRRFISMSAAESDISLLAIPIVFDTEFYTRDCCLRSTKQSGFQWRLISNCCQVWVILTSSCDVWWQRWSAAETFATWTKQTKRTWHERWAIKISGETLWSHSSRDTWCLMYYCQLDF